MGVFYLIGLLGFLTSLVAGQTTITISPGTKLQHIDGFGISEAFGRASQFEDNTPTALRAQAIDLLFNKTSGAGFSIIRNRIGSDGVNGDFTIEPNSPGSSTSTPTYIWDDDDRGQVWFSQQAISYGISTIYADAWSAPGFMKTSGSDVTAGFLCDEFHSCSTGDWKQAYANYLVKYIQDYKTIGITITHIGFLNEPDLTVTYSQMQISTNAQEAISFIRVLNTTLVSAGLNSVKIACCDAVGWNDQITYTTNLVNSGATAHMGVITSHAYSSSLSAPLTTSSLPKWNTEVASSGAFSTTWFSSGADNEGFFWAQKLATGMITAQLSAYLYWEGFEFESSTASHLLDTDSSGTTITISAPYYAFAMWSRYIRPGAFQVATSGSTSTVMVGAFLNSDNSLVAMITNSGTASVSVALAFNGFTANTASAHVTDNNNKFAALSSTVSGGRVTVSVPAHGLVTVVIN